MGIEFFRRSVELAERYRRPDQHRHAHHPDQRHRCSTTSGPRFFKQHGFLVGLSVDGPRAMHDAYRVTQGGQRQLRRGDRAAGRLLRRHGVDVNILCTRPRRQRGPPARGLPLLPRRAGGRSTSSSSPSWSAPLRDTLAPGERGLERAARARRAPCTGSRVTASPGARSTRGSSGAFLIDIFDEWVRRDVGGVFVQMFDVALGSWVGQHNLCIFSPDLRQCAGARAQRRSVLVRPLRRAGLPAGNITETPMLATRSLRRGSAGSGRPSTRRCRSTAASATVLFACYGECPRNRFLKTPATSDSRGGQEGLNYLCAGYRLFFHHVREPMLRMAGLLRSGLPAAEIMRGTAA